MEPQRNPNIQSNLEKEQSWRHRRPLLQTTLQTYSNQKGVLLALKQTHI